MAFLWCLLSVTMHTPYINWTLEFSKRKKIKKIKIIWAIYTFLKVMSHLHYINFLLICTYDLLQSHNQCRSPQRWHFQNWPGDNIVTLKYNNITPCTVNRCLIMESKLHIYFIYVVEPENNVLMMSVFDNHEVVVCQEMYSNNNSYI